MNRFEQDYYNDVSSIEKSLKRIADALENSNVTKVEPVEVKPADVGTDLDPNVNEDDINNDYLSNLVQDMSSQHYLEFCHEMGWVSNDANLVSNNIYELEDEETLGVIKTALNIIGGGKTDDQANEEVLESDFHTCNGEKDPYTYEPNPNRDKGEPALTEHHCGVVNDSDFEIRKTAKYYTEQIGEWKDIRTKKDAILDYVTNEFGSHGARYTDIIKFAYYLGAHNAPKYTSENRGYYSLAFSLRKNGYLITGGKDQFVKGINKEGIERYFALSFVESVTDYWRYLDR